MLQCPIAEHRWWWAGNSVFPAVLCFYLVWNQLCLTDLILWDLVWVRHKTITVPCAFDMLYLSLHPVNIFRFQDIRWNVLVKMIFLLRNAIKCLHWKTKKVWDISCLHGILVVDKLTGWVFIFTQRFAMYLIYLWNSA